MHGIPRRILLEYNKGKFGRTSLINNSNDIHDNNSIYSTIYLLYLGLRVVGGGSTLFDESSLTFAPQVALQDDLFLDLLAVQEFVNHVRDQLLLGRRTDLARFAAADRLVAPGNDGRVR